MSHLSLFYYTSIQLSGQEVNGVSLSLFYYTSIQLSGQEVNGVIDEANIPPITCHNDHRYVVTSVTLLIHIHPAIRSGSQQCQSRLFFRSLMLLLVAGSTLGHAKYGVPWLLFNVVITSALWIPFDILSTSIP